MFLQRQNCYFEAPNFVPAASIRWKEVLDRIYSHDNFDPRAFYGDPSDAQQLVRSPQMLDSMFGDHDSSA